MGFKEWKKQGVGVAEAPSGFEAWKAQSAAVRPSYDVQTPPTPLRESLGIIPRLTPKITKKQVAKSPTFLKFRKQWEEEQKQLKQGLVKQVGLSMYNKLVAIPGHELAKTDLTAAGVRAHEVQTQRMKARKKQGLRRFTDILLEDEFQDVTEQLYLNPEARESEDLKALPSFTRPAPDVNPLAAQVQASKAVEVGTSIAAFVTQLALLKKTYPNIPNAGIWELQSSLTGGKPGEGAATFAAFSLPGKLIPGVTKAAKVGRVAAQSITLAGITALESKVDTGEIDWMGVGISVGIPVALRTPGMVKKLIRARNPKIMKALAIAHPELLERLPKQRKLVETGIIGITKRSIITPPSRLGTVKKAWNIKWGGKNVSNLRNTVQGLLELTKKEKNVTKLTKLADRIEILDRQIESIKDVNIRGKGFKELHKLARKQGIKIPKGTTKTGIRQLLQGNANIIETSDGYYVRNLLAKSKAGTGWSLKKYPTLQAAQEALAFQEAGIKALKVAKPRLRIRGEVGKETVPITPAIKPTAKPVTVKSTGEILQKWSATAKKTRKEVIEKEVHKLRQQQAVKSAAIYKAERAKGTPRLAALLKAQKVKGKVTMPEVEPPKLSPQQWDVYAKRIEQIYPAITNQFQRTDAGKALEKIRTGHIPTNFEFGLLDPVLGRETTTKLFTNLAAQRTFSLWDVPKIARDYLKTMFGYDPQTGRALAGIRARHPVIYTKSYAVNVAAMASAKYSNKMEKAVTSSKNWEIGKKDYSINFLSMKPWATVRAGTKLQQFGHVSDLLIKSKSPTLRAQGRWLKASERGAEVGINYGLEKQVAYAEKAVARMRASSKWTPAQIKKWQVQRGKDINAFSKRIVAKEPAAREIQQAANWTLFSPAYTAARPYAIWRSIANLVTGRGLAGRTYAAQLTLANIASLGAMSSIGAWVGHKWRVNNPTEEPKVDSSNNPADGLWGKIRVGENVIDLSMGEVSTYRLFARLGVSAYLKGQELLTGKERTTFMGRKTYSVGEEFKRYLQSRETVILGLADTLATGKDWMGKPITLKQTALEHFPIEFIESVVEGGLADGLWEDMVAGDVRAASKAMIKNLPIGALELAGVGTLRYPVRAATTRMRFKDIVAKGKYNKKWDELTQREQRRLQTTHRKQFNMLAERVRQERVEEPYDPTKIIEAELKSGKKITKLLSKGNRAITQGVKLGVSRSPKKFYLNDERYQKYQELVAKYLNDLLSRKNFAGKSEKVRIKMVEASKNVAKIKAFNQLRREIK